MRVLLLCGKYPFIFNYLPGQFLRAEGFPFRAATSAACALDLCNKKAL